METGRAVVYYARLPMHLVQELNVGTVCFQWFHLLLVLVQRSIIDVIVISIVKLPSLVRACLVQLELIREVRKELDVTSLSTA